MQELIDRLEILIAAEQIACPHSDRLRGMQDLVLALRDRMTTIIIRSKPRVQENDEEWQRLWRRA